MESCYFLQKDSEKNKRLTKNPNAYQTQSRY